MGARAKIRRDLGWIEIRLRCGESQEHVAATYGIVAQGLYKVRKAAGLKPIGHRRGVSHWNWQGGYQMSAGYEMVRVGPGKRDYEYEHRVVMERMIGRKLKPGEVVHHIDGDKLNNAESNLRLFSSQAEHITHEH